MTQQECRFGLIGFPLGHSASASYFAKKFEREGLKTYSYTLFPLLSADEIIPLIKKTPSLQGFNVTIPYKQSIIAFLNHLDPVAREIGAVNTVKITSSGSEFELRGYNTDAEGFRKSLRSGFHNTHALILGTGGSSKAVAYSLKKMGLDVLLVSRSKTNLPAITYSDINSAILEQYTFIVNCTPAGMFPDINQTPPFPTELLHQHHEVYDLIYNPAETKFLHLAREAGAKTQNGLKMFELQAELAFKIWKG